MTLKEAEAKYGTVDTYINQLRELVNLDDWTLQDVRETLREVNFIRGEAGLEPIGEVEIMDLIQYGDF